MKRLLGSVLLLSVSVGTPAQDVLECEKRPGKPPATPLGAGYITKISPILTCKAEIDDRTACNVFLGRALKVLFDNKDFATGKDSYMLANDIAHGLANSAASLGWSKVGNASDQTALDKAQAYANAGRAVVAARKGIAKADGTVGPGHVVLIMPGQTEVYSAKDFGWNNLSTPNSASVFLNAPARTYLSCPLSASWKKPDGVEIFVKN